MHRRSLGKTGHTLSAIGTSSARLPDLVSLILSRPLISVPLAAKELKVSPQSIEGMLKELGALRELTGRGRYRPWAVV